ncbi:putative aldouronate transport system permease protein [Paenibacillus taihuensis]|uniref:Putative aldouronate transport system permease protein n=1 Tax=Paenibacillus taihuensis TaxID=1156355 RepID=A0A3D9QU69_9BACL|nr:carbohydrate ABC transporter permease [Paenibacillus taihuensis]REE66975.1 putative aldouronate transport system permease protein [Paenibacillus taihuensis]
MQRSRGERWFNVVNMLFMLVFAFLCMYPFIYILAISFNDAMDAQKGGIYIWPRMFSMKNYSVIFSDQNIFLAYGVTIGRVVVGVITQVLLVAMFAYVLTKKNFPLRRFLNWWIVIPMFLSGGLIPFYITLQQLHLLNSFWTYIIPGLYGAFNIMLVRTFMSELPEALEESAKMDGASDARIFFSIIFPLSKPVLATIALFVGVSHWNDWFTGFTFISNTKLWTAQNLLLFLIQSNEASNLAVLSKMHQGAVTVTAESIKMAMLIVTTAPILCIYPFLQKYFVKGIMLGSLKG